jgi:hypothetical protein
MCDRWKFSFENFLADIGQRPSSDVSIDRIDNDGNYEPGNVRWATPSQQSNNRRSNRLLEFYGKLKTVTEWSAISGVPMRIIHNRLSSGNWSNKDAVWTPIEVWPKPSAAKKATALKKTRSTNGRFCSSIH